MKKIKLIIMVIFIPVLIFYRCQGKLNPIQINEKSILEQISTHPDFQKWYQFWHDRSSYVDINTLEFSMFRSEKFSLHYKIESERLDSYTIKNILLNYSPRSDFLIDIYADCVFEQIGMTDSLRFFGGDVDRSFTLVSLKDSLIYWRTYGTTSYFDESLWLTDSCFVIIGISFWPTAIADSSYDQIMLIKGNINTMSLEQYISQKLPRIFSSFDYMLYKYPKVVW